MNMVTHFVTQEFIDQLDSARYVIADALTDETLFADNPVVREALVVFGAVADSDRGTLMVLPEVQTEDQFDETDPDSDVIGTPSTNIDPGADENDNDYEDTGEKDDDTWSPIPSTSGGDN